MTNPKTANKNGKKLLWRYLKGEDFQPSVPNYNEKLWFCDVSAKICLHRRIEVTYYYFSLNANYATKTDKYAQTTSRRNLDTETVQPVFGGYSLVCETRCRGMRLHDPANSRPQTFFRFNPDFCSNPMPNNFYNVMISLHRPNKAATQRNYF